MIAGEPLLEAGGEQALRNALLPWREPKAPRNTDSERGDWHAVDLWDSLGSGQCAGLRAVWMAAIGSHMAVGRGRASDSPSITSNAVKPYFA